MGKTKFRLEALLKIRRLAEDRAKRVVAERLREIQQVRQRIASLDDQLAEAAQVMRSLVLAGSIVPLEATRQRGYIGWLQQRRLGAEVEQGRIEAQLAQDRSVLAEASKQCKILEKLEQRQEQRRIRLENLAEQRAGDEMAVLRFAHERLMEADEGAAGAGVESAMVDT